MLSTFDLQISDICQNGHGHKGEHQNETTEKQNGFERRNFNENALNYINKFNAGQETGIYKKEPFCAKITHRKTSIFQ